MFLFKSVLINLPGSISTTVIVFHNSECSGILSKFQGTFYNVWEHLKCSQTNLKWLETFQKCSCGICSGNNSECLGTFKMF